MSELINFRDFGGYPTKDGKHVVKGHFFRSGSYRDLTKKDIEYIQSLNIQNLHDFREKHELDKKESHEEIAKKVHMISASAHLGGFEESEDQAFTVLSSESMIEFYRQLPFNNPAYKNIFKVLQEPNATPYLHNCTAGKDRTGIATALIQFALGIDENIIMLDYMKSMDAFEQVYQNEVRRLKDGRDESSLLHKMPGIVIMPSFLQAAYESIIEKYNSMSAYFEAEFGLNESKLMELRLMYTE